MKGIKEIELIYLDVTQANKQINFLDIAKTYRPEGCEKLCESMKLAGEMVD